MGTEKIKSEKIDARSVAACLVAEGLDATGEVDVLVERLQKHFLVKDAGDLFECSECSAAFPGRIKACCPFCAINDDMEHVDATPQTYGAPPESKAPETPGEPDEKTRKIQERARKKAEAAEAKKAKAPPAPAPKPTEPVVEAVVEPARAEKEKDEAAKTTALAKREEKAKLARAGEQELDAAVSEIRRLKSDIALNYWHLGRKIHEVFEKSLWKQRLDEEGKGGVYKTSGFDGWVKEETGFTVTSAYEIMEVSKHYTESQVRAFGYAKLGMVLKAPPEAQAKLLAEKVEAGASWREVRAAVREAQAASPQEPKPARDGTMRGKGGAQRAREPRPLTIPGGPAPEKTTKKDVITIASIKRRQKIPVMAKPAKRGDAPKPAKRLADEPYFTIEFENEVVLKVTIAQNPAGELVAHIDARREDEDESKAAE